MQKYGDIIFCLPNCICKDIGMGYFEYKTRALPIFIIKSFLMLNQKNIEKLYKTY